METVKFTSKLPSFSVLIHPGHKVIKGTSIVSTRTKTVEFENGEAEVAPDVAVIMRKSKLFNIYFTESTGDVEVMQAVKENIKSADVKEDKPVMMYKEFVRDYFASKTGVSMKDCAAAWKEYKGK